MTPKCIGCQKKTTTTTVVKGDNNQFAGTGKCELGEHESTVRKQILFATMSPTFTATLLRKLK